MKRTMKTEFWKAFHNPMFCLAVAIGIAISMGNVLRNAQAIHTFDIWAQSLGADSPFSRSGLGYSLFIQWLPVARTSTSHYLFSFIWPILAAMPFGWSYFQERKNGVYSQIVSRCGRPVYLLSKFAGLFVSGGLAVALPVLFDLLANAMVCPDVLPKAIAPINIISDGWFLSEVYFTYPWLYAIAWCAVQFLLGGAAASICLAVGTKLRLQIMVILAPFALLLLFDACYSVLSQTFGWNVTLSPLTLSAAAAVSPNPEWAFCFRGIGRVSLATAGTDFYLPIQWLLVMAASTMIGCIKCKHSDILGQEE